MSATKPTATNLNNQISNEEHRQMKEKVESSFQSSNGNQVNQNQFESVQTNSNVCRKRKSPTELTLNLTWGLKSDVINNLIKFSYLLNAGSIKVDDKKSLIKMNNDLIQRLSILRFSDNSNRNENKLNENLNLIDSNILIDLTENEDELMLEINWDTRGRLIDLLVKNFGSLFLFNGPIPEEDKKELIKENNNLIRLLLDLDVKNGSSLDEYEDDIDEADNRCLKKLKVDKEITRLTESVVKIEKKLEDIDRLKKEIKKVDMKNNEVTFTFDVKEVDDFLKSRKEVRSEFFYCNSVPWYLKVKSNNLVDGIEYIEGVKNEETSFDCDWSIRADVFKLKLLHNAKESLDKVYPFKNKIFKKEDNWGLSKFISVPELTNHIKNNVIRFQVFVKADRIVKRKNIHTSEI